MRLLPSFQPMQAESFQKYRNGDNRCWDLSPFWTHGTNCDYNDEHSDFLFQCICYEPVAECFFLFSLLFSCPSLFKTPKVANLKSFDRTFGTGTLVRGFSRFYVQNRQVLSYICARKQVISGPFIPLPLQSMPTTVAFIKLFHFLLVRNLDFFPLLQATPT